MPRLRTPLLATAFVAASILGGALLSEGLWIKGKAEVAQFLLERAWAKTRIGDSGVKPWPWADMVPAYELRVPRLGASAIVLNTASGEALAFAPGWMPSTARPGEPGLALIAAHRDTHFAFLKDVSEGDKIVVRNAQGAEARFEVAAARIVSAARSGLNRDMQGTWLALSTCWPFGAVTQSDQRYVVLARAL
ncbi:MAG: class GN sortase [Pseudomonadota bacterium]